MQKNKKEEKLKKLFQVSERISAIYQLKKKLEPKKLNKPIPHGHYRYVTVRADVLRSSVGGQIQKIVYHCNHWILGDKKDSKSFEWPHTEVLAGLNERGYVRKQLLKPLSQSEWDQAKFPDFFEKKWFKVLISVKSFGSKNVTTKRYFPNVPEHMLTFEYCPAYIVAVSSVDGDLDSEEKKLRDLMDESNGYPRLYGKDKDEWSESLEKKRILNRLSKKEIEEYKNGNSPEEV